MGDDDDGQAGVAQRGAFGPAALLVELDLVAHPLSRTRNVLWHGDVLSGDPMPRAVLRSPRAHLGRQGRSDACTCQGAAAVELPGHTYAFALAPTFYRDGVAR